MSVDPGELLAKIDNIHHDVSIPSSFNEFKQLKEALEPSRSNLQLWHDTWLLGTSDPTARPERLWGKDGWIKIQDILAEMVETTTILEDAHKDAEVESDRAKVGRKPKWRIYMLRLKKPQATNSKLQYTIDVAFELGQAIERLWIHSEMIYESLHGIPARNRGSPAINSAISVRQGAVALYEACHRSTGQCELDLDLLRDRSMPPDSQTTPYAASDTSIFYRIFVRSKTDSKLDMWDIIAESLDEPGAAAISPTVKVHEEPDLSVFETSPASSSYTIGIQPSYSRKNYYFRVTAAHTVTDSLSKNESLALLSKSNAIPTGLGSPHSLTWIAKINLAYDLVQCGFYLLGTPWLAGLSSKSLRSIETKDRKVSVLDVTTMPLDYHFLHDHDGLSEISQLLRLGIILIDIALDSHDTSDPGRLDDPHLYAAKRLPLVYEAIGSNYYRACAFCVQDRRSSKPYERWQKYEYPDDTGWEVDLKDLLTQYHDQVVSR